MTSGTSWADMFNAPAEPQESDPATDALLSMIPEQHRDFAAPMMRGLFSQIQAQLGPENYAVFCRDLQGAATQYLAGNREPAAQLFGAYGMDIRVIEAMAGVSPPAAPLVNDPETGEPFLPI